jgi:hypothetical protein
VNALPNSSDPTQGTIEAIRNCWGRASASVAGAKLAARRNNTGGNQRLKPFSRGHFLSALQRSLVRCEQFHACEWNSIQSGLAVFRRVFHFSCHGLLAKPCAGLSIFVRGWEVNSLASFTGSVVMTMQLRCY